MMAINKLRLRNFKLREGLSEDELAKHMSMLTNCVKLILHGEKVPSNNEIYKCCELVCRYGHCRSLYLSVHNECVAFCRTELAEQWRGIISASSVDNILDMWEEFERRVRLLKDVLSVMDRIYVKKEAGLVRVCQAIHGTFRSAIWEPEKTRIIKHGLSLQDRCRDTLNVEVYPKLRAYWGILERLQVFNTQEVTGAIMERTSKFLNSYFMEQSRSNSGRILDALLTRIENEDILTISCFPECIQGAIKSTLRRNLISDHLQFFTGSLFSEILRNMDGEKCKKLYQLLSIVEAIPQMATAFSSYVKEAVASVQAENSIQNILDLKDKVDELVVNGFGNDLHFVSAAKEGLEAAINRQTAKTSEMLARHINQLLTQQVIDIEPLKTEIRKSIILFRYLQGKETFESYYKQYLATRLLSMHTCGMDFEHLAISLIKEECGAAFTSRMEGTIRDVANSRDTSASFAKTPAYRNRGHSFQFSTSVITSGIWPIPEAVDMYLPESVKGDASLFESYYCKYAKKRRLKWEHAYGECVIRAPFDNGHIELEMPTFVAAVFLQFNKSDEQTTSNLKKLSKLPDKWFSKALILLSSHNILKVNGNKVVFNTKIDLPERVHIYDTLLPLTAPEEKIIEDVSVLRQQDREERAYRLDAAIVRYLKKHQSATLSDLQGSCGELDLLEERLVILKEREYCRHENGQYFYIP